MPDLPSTNRNRREWTPWGWPQRTPGQHLQTETCANQHHEDDHRERQIHHLQTETCEDQHHEDDHKERQVDHLQTQWKVTDAGMKVFDSMSHTYSFGGFQQSKPFYASVLAYCDCKVVTLMLGTNNTWRGRKQKQQVWQNKTLKSLVTIIRVIWTFCSHRWWGC